MKEGEELISVKADDPRNAQLEIIRQTALIYHAKLIDHPRATINMQQYVQDVSFLFDILHGQAEYIKIIKGIK